MKKLLFVGAIVLGTYAFSACDNKANTENDETVVSSDTVVEADTTVEQTVVETDTTTRTVEAGEGTDTIK